MGPNLLIIGKTGQLARALARQTEKNGQQAVFLDREACDLSGSAQTIVNALKRQSKPDIIIIAAAYTAVDTAETDEETAFTVNGAAPCVIADYCAMYDIPLVHISTDYVFDGENKSPYLTDHETGPKGVYGASKLAGEEGVLKSECKAAIIRTSWVFDGLGTNFLTTMLRLAQNRDSLNIVNDQIGRPTYAGDLARAALVVACALYENIENAQGIFHVSGKGDPISWADFAASIFELSNELESQIKIIGIPSSQYPTPAIRPKFSVLDNSRFEEVFDYSLPSWKDGLREALAEREQNKR